jgi:LmbE family N-acetylglucosaminyl deacetylase
MQKPAVSRRLVIAAHPDDEVLGCGGTMARLTREGHEVYFSILGEGITSRYPKGEEIDPALMAALQHQSQTVACLLGAKVVFQGNLPDNRFDTVPLLEVIKTVEELIANIKPKVIYTHHGGDLNIDHQVTHRAVLTATRPQPGHLVREIYAFEVVSASEWAFQCLTPSFRPNFFVDITDTLEIKLQAMLQYEGEVRPFPHPRSIEAIRDTARRWGSVVGCGAAEAFELIRAVDLRSNQP